MGVLTEEQYLAAAKELRHRDGETEIEDGATVSTGEDAGAYVQAWVWVSDSEACEALGLDAEGKPLSEEETDEQATK